MIDVENILEKMKPNQKINYDWVMQQMVKQWQASDIRPKILMHVCCAPCSTYTLEYLSQWADVTIYFANSNILLKNLYMISTKILDILYNSYQHHMNQMNFSKLFMG